MKLWSTLWRVVFLIAMAVCVVYLLFKGINNILYGSSTWGVVSVLLASAAIYLFAQNVRTAIAEVKRDWPDTFDSY